MLRSWKGTTNSPVTGDSSWLLEYTSRQAPRQVAPLFASAPDAASTRLASDNAGPESRTLESLSGVANASASFVGASLVRAVGAGVVREGRVVREGVAREGVDTRISDGVVSGQCAHRVSGNRYGSRRHQA